MRLILSRKGFDSSAGKVPSPILPVGRIASLPIPERGSGTKYEEVRCLGRSLGDVVNQLTKGKMPPHYEVHLDPDLDPAARPRLPGWLPSLGQAGGAQGTLRKAGIAAGDVFLFFGWFRQAEEVGGRLRFVKGTPGVHVIFGWLQVGEMVDVSAGPIPSWAERHPHIVRSERKSNTIYVATPELELEGEALGVPGGGTFTNISQGMVLTGPDQRLRSSWSLPSWFYPSEGRPPLGYHSSLDRWNLVGDRVELTATSRGQEFVLDCEYYPEAVPWLRGLLGS